MIAHDSWWSNERARFNYHRLSSTIIDYHVPFDQGLKQEQSKREITLNTQLKIALSWPQGMLIKVPNSPTHRSHNTLDLQDYISGLQ